MNVCKLEKGDLDKLDNIVNCLLWRERFHVTQSSYKRFYTKRKVDSRGLKRFKEIYYESKPRVTY